MKPLRKHLKPIALFLAVIFLAQSCKIYDKPVSVSEAASIRKPVKIIGNSDKEYVFKKIFYENNQLFGKPYGHGGLGIIQPKNIMLQEESIRTVYMRNQNIFVFTSVLAVIVTGVLIFVGMEREGWASW